MKRIQKFLNQYILYILGIFSILVALPVFYSLLYKTSISVPYIQLSNLHKVVLVNGELVILALLYKKYVIPEWKSAKPSFLARDFLFLNCILILPFFLFYTNPLLRTMPFFRENQPFIITAYFALVGISILLILSTSTRINQIHHWISNQIETKRFQDEKMEIDRSHNFQLRYTGWSQIIIIRNLAEAIYREGFIVILSLLVLFLFGLVLRTWNLDKLPPYSDEIIHMITARSLAQGFTHINNVDYTRSLFTVTLPVVFFTQIFGFSLWNARMVGVLVNLLAIIPIYLLVKRVNKSIALLAIGLFVTSPWIIAVSRNVREYAVYPLFFYFTALVMVKLYESLPDNFLFMKHMRVFASWKYLLLVGYLAFILVFVTTIDRFSTFVVILALYPVFAFLLIRKIDWLDRKNLMVMGGMIILFILILGILFSNWGGYDPSIRKKIHVFFISLFYEKPIQQWYYGRPLISITLTVLALLATSLWNKKHFVQPFAVLVFGGPLIMFSYFSIKTDRPRYAIAIEFWFILLIAVGLYVAYLLINKLLAGKYKPVSWLIIIILFWNVPHTFLPALYTTPGWHPITDEYHGDVEPSYKYLKSHIGPDDTLVTTSFLYNSFQLLGGIESGNMVDYDYRQQGSYSDIYRAIETFPSGWIALDYQRGFLYSYPVPLKDFDFAGKKVRFIDWIGDVYLLNWGEE